MAEEKRADLSCVMQKHRGWGAALAKDTDVEEVVRQADKSAVYVAVEDGPSPPGGGAGAPSHAAQNQPAPIAALRHAVCQVMCRTYKANITYCASTVTFLFNLI